MQETHNFYPVVHRTIENEIFKHGKHPQIGAKTGTPHAETWREGQADKRFIKAGEHAVCRNGARSLGNG
jgi:hypothetical protein